MDWLPFVSVSYGFWIASSITYCFIASQVYFIFKKSSSTVIIRWTLFLWLFFILLSLPIFLVALLISIVYRQFSTTILLLKYGNRFGGLLSGADTVHVLDTAKRSKLGVLFIIEYDEKSPKSFFEIVRHAICNTKLKKCPKTCAVFKKSFGYYYLLKNEVNIEECIHKLTVDDDTETPVDEETFMRFLHKSEEIPLPKNNQGLWDVFIGIYPIKWNSTNTNSNKTFYPVLFRFHHCLFDGFHFIRTIFGAFADNPVSDSVEHTTNVNSCLTIDDSCVFKTLILVKNIFKFLVNQICIITIIPWRLLLLITAKDNNNLCGLTLSDEKLFSFNAEEFPHYVQVIKTIKNKFPGTSFTDIILTAISASLSKHIEQNSVIIPEYITIATPEVPQATELLRTPILSNSACHVKCQNKVCFSLRKVPAKTAITLHKRLELVKMENSYFKNPTEVLADYMISHLCFAVFPEPILLRLMKNIRYTAITTNLPGPPQTTVFGGNTVRDMVMWSICKETTGTGISFLILTYDGRLEITVSVDKAVISSTQEIKNILADIYKSLDELNGTY